jgi:hypothetical protein
MERLRMGLSAPLVGLSTKFEPIGTRQQRIIELSTDDAQARSERLRVEPGRSRLELDLKRLKFGRLVP